MPEDEMNQRETVMPEVQAMRGLRLAAQLGIPTLALALLLAGCASGGPRDGTGTEQLTFAPSLAVDPARMIRTASGLYYEELRLGEGKEAGGGDRVAVHYAGWLPDGSLFDSTVPPADPVRFTLGRGEVIRGWEEGVMGMRAGGVRKLVVPPNLAYGSRGLPGAVPRNATLVFQIELAEVGGDLEPRISSAIIRLQRGVGRGESRLGDMIPLTENPSRALVRPPI
jgi:FKBP-type peptidyl-prolyl cis-trans isomerase FkpA